MKRIPLETSRHVQEPILPWQTGEYSRTQHIELTLPYSFLLFCKLVSVTPKEMIEKLLDDLAQGTWKNESSKAERALLFNYLKLVKYPQRSFTEQEMETLLLEMSVFSNMDLTNADNELLTTHEMWRLHYLHHWYKKWNAIARNRTPGHSRA